MTTNEFLCRLAVVKLQKPDIYNDLLQQPIVKMVQMMEIVDEVLSDPELKPILDRVKAKGKVVTP